MNQGYSGYSLGICGGKLGGPPAPKSMGGNPAEPGIPGLGKAKPGGKPGGNPGGA